MRCMYLVMLNKEICHVIAKIQSQAWERVALRVATPPPLLDDSQ